MMMYSAVLLKAEVKALQAANEQKKRRERKCKRSEVKALQAANEQKKRRERKRKRRIMQGGSLSIQDAEDIL
ncbi:hypothetical protein V496_00558 [Pseudogymnoascus sp. VKM F-4515 (FW-2607)]|nr:hypothetical protein V496_00558 [Pseudogymnoascus sp. VKM F-4515 (FW-2607)]